MTDSSPTSSSSAFARLAEGVQRQLYAMQWPSLRPIQCDAIHAYLDSSDDLLIIAETAGGKTEAAFLPVLSAIARDGPGSVRAVYVGPLKALINDQFGRLEELCTHLEIPVWKWHGDASAAQKAALVRSPSGVLLITPESLESLFVNRTGHLDQLFGGLRAVVIDELHSFLDNERGLHLASLLSRLRGYTRRVEPPFRMLGLSATIGDVEGARKYLSLDAPERVRVITDAGAGSPLQMRLHGYFEPEEDDTQRTTVRGETLTTEVEGEEGEGDEPASNIDEASLAVMREIATDLVEHCRQSSNLVFANAKADIEIYADLANEICEQQGVPPSFLVHHGSLSKEVREDTEDAMKRSCRSSQCTAICSSTLEMGIDIGSVRMVGQIGAPWSVASLKQRMGRSGRRGGESRRLRMYIKCGRKPVSVPQVIPPLDALKELPLELLQSVAVCQLMLAKWIEPARQARLDLSTLTQQVISCVAERGAVSAADLYNRLCRSGPFRGVPTGLFGQFLRQLGVEDVIEQGPDGLLILGLEGERIRSRKEFYAAFASEAEFDVVCDERTLGTLPSRSLPNKGDRIVFAGRRWEVIDLDLSRSQLFVRPARKRGRPKFPGGGGEVHPRVREQMLAVLRSHDGYVYLDPVATEAVEAAREIAAAAQVGERGIRALHERQCLLLTWTGTVAQRTLLAVLAGLGLECQDHLIAIECPCSDGELKERLRWFARVPLAPKELAAYVQPKVFRKYDGILSDVLRDEAIAADRLDLAECTSVIRESLL